MTGKYDILVSTPRVTFHLSVKRNITILTGDSATGKTSLIHSLSNALNDKGAAESVSCDKQCVVINQILPNLGDYLKSLKDCIVFMDEDISFMLTREFAEIVKHSDCYFVLVTREPLCDLPYSMYEIYEFHTTGKTSEHARSVYTRAFSLLKHNTSSSDITPDFILTEDSNSGYDFFSSLVQDSDTSEGAPAVVSYLKKHVMPDRQVLVCLDSAAFGAYAIDLLDFLKANHNVKVYTPESFEWVLLKSGLFDNEVISTLEANPSVKAILDAPYDYAVSSKFFSWERFFEHCLRVAASHQKYKYL